MWFSYCQLFVLPVILLLMLLMHAFITQWCFQWCVCFLRTRIMCKYLLDFSDILWGPLNTNRKQPLVTYVMHRHRSWSSLSSFGRTTFLWKHCACTLRAPITAGPLQKFFLRPCTRLMKGALFPAVWFIFGSQELTLKLPGRGSKPLRTTIKEHAPWKLKQVGTGISWPLTSPFCLPSFLSPSKDSGLG